MKILKELEKMRIPEAVRELEAMRETRERLRNYVQTAMHLQKRRSRHGDYKQGSGRERRWVCGTTGYQY